MTGVAGGLAGCVVTGLGRTGVRTGTAAAGVGDAAVAAGGVTAGVCSGAAAFVFESGAATVSPVIDPVDQILSRLSLLISNSIALRRGLNGAIGGAIFFPLMVSWTYCASDLE